MYACMYVHQYILQLCKLKAAIFKTRRILILWQEQLQDLELKNDQVLKTLYHVPVAK